MYENLPSIVLLGYQKPYASRVQVPRTIRLVHAENLLVENAHLSRSGQQIEG